MSGAVLFILEQLAIGSYREAIQPLRGITAVLNVAAEREMTTALLYHKVPIIDMRPIPPHQLQEAVVWIHAHIAQHTILVSCNAGVGRSPSVVIGYLCCCKGYGYNEAVQFVARRKPHISPLPELPKTIAAIKSAFE